MEDLWEFNLDWEHILIHDFWEYSLDFEYNILLSYHCLVWLRIYYDQLRIKFPRSDCDLCFAKCWQSWIREEKENPKSEKGVYQRHLIKKITIKILSSDGYYPCWFNLFVGISFFSFSCKVHVERCIYRIEFFYFIFN